MSFSYSHHQYVPFAEKDNRHRHIDAKYKHIYTNQQNKFNAKEHTYHSYEIHLVNIIIENRNL